MQITQLPLICYKRTEKNKEFFKVTSGMKQAHFKVRRKFPLLRHHDLLILYFSRG